MQSYSPNIAYYLAGPSSQQVILHEKTQCTTGAAVCGVVQCAMWCSEMTNVALPGENQVHVDVKRRGESSVNVSADGGKRQFSEILREFYKPGAKITNRGMTALSISHL